MGSNPPVEKVSNWIRSLTLLLASACWLNAQGTAFTYQGRLTDGGLPATGTYDLQFNLWDSGVDGSRVVSPISVPAVTVSNGLFTVTLDFGGVFNGGDRWLAINVRTNGATVFSPLSPRQRLTPAPYSVYAINAGAAATATVANSIGGIYPTNVAQLDSQGVVDPANLPGNLGDWTAVPTNALGGVAPGVTNQWRLDATNAAATVTASALAVVTVSPKGIANGSSGVTNDGKMFGPDTPGTTTCGLQEAYNALPTSLKYNGDAGGTIQLAPGAFYITTGLNMPGLNSTAFNLYVEGAGLSASCIVYAGSTPSHALMIGQPNYGSAMNVGLSKLTIASCNNATTNIVWINGTYDLAKPGATGGIASADVDRLWIGYWPSMTNNAGGIFTPSGYPDNIKHNLIGLDVNLMFNNLIHIHDCQFSYCLVGLSISADHPSIEHNTFNFCGNNVSIPCDWPWTTSWRVGAGLDVFHGYRTAGLQCTFPHTFRCVNNTYIANSALSYSPAIIVDNTRDCGNLFSFTFEYENFEWDGGQPVFLSGPYTRSTFINPIGYRDYRFEDLAKTVNASTTDWSAWNTTPAGTNIIRTLDWMNNLYDGPFDIEDGGGIKNVHATNIVQSAVHVANPNDGVAIDATTAYQFFTTNATYAVAGFTGLIAGMQHILSMTVSNASTSPINWIGPSTAFYLGPGSTNVLTIPAHKEGVISFWIWPNSRTNVSNVLQQ